MANPNPSPATRFKPGNTAGTANKHVQQVERFYKFMGDLPDQITPWERIHQITESPECPPELVIKGKALLGNWVLNSSNTSVEVVAEQVHIHDIDHKLLNMLKTDEELAAEEAEEEEEADEENSQG